SDPAPRYETESWLAEQLGVDPKPLEQTVDGRGTGHKRCSNKGLLGSGYQLLYPGYRDGYRAVLDERT
ncbi:MAG: hypothetical protein ACJASY_004425, partial [Halioglobus sp.]